MDRAKMQPSVHPIVASLPERLQTFPIHGQRLARVRPRVPIFHGRARTALAANQSISWKHPITTPDSAKNNASAAPFRPTHELFLSTNGPHPSMMDSLERCGKSSAKGIEGAPRKCELIFWS